MTADIQTRFARDTAQHEMTVLHTNGLYRHLRFKNPTNFAYWFDLITWPGCLTIRGDLGDSYTFSRLPDMFEFFRGKQINAHYWAEKLDTGRNSAKEYSEDLFRQLVTEHVAGAIRHSDAPRGIGKAVRAEILDQDLTVEAEARDLLEDFRYQGFEFHDIWEWSFSDYTRQFLWACHAIQWGIAQYDARPASSSEAAAVARLRTAWQSARKRAAHASASMPQCPTCGASCTNRTHDRVYREQGY
ncbi:hypothetical protein [Kitasatospora sp. NPDC001175]|uniref:hypothetical protein n=1 Tax=Kitasatospora sp. NPDC001175 TaxID=3157103 RepID=UPI003D011B04